MPNNYKRNSITFFNFFAIIKFIHFSIFFFYKLQICGLYTYKYFFLNIQQVVSNRETNETLLCIAYVFEVANSNCGAQHHIYRLVKDQPQHWAIDETTFDSDAICNNSATDFNTMIFNALLIDNKIILNAWKTLIDAKFIIIIIFFSFLFRFWNNLKYYRTQLCQTNRILLI